MIGNRLKLIESEIKGVFIIENFNFFDERGSFVKIFNNEEFNMVGINFNPKEIYYSVSNKDVIRGMHFQIPPYEHAKLIYVISGSIVDVVLDIRKNSKTFGKYVDFHIEAHKKAIYIPIGCAHGFKSLEDNTTVVYNQTSVYNKESDMGIRWNSFDYDWRIKNTILSERDKSFDKFSLNKGYFL